jgi:hypothetical protein
VGLSHSRTKISFDEEQEKKRIAQKDAVKTANPCNDRMWTILSLTETIQHINEILNIIEIMHWIVIRSTSQKLEIRENVCVIV